jgi:hypothetical protein
MAEESTSGTDPHVAAVLADLEQLDALEVDRHVAVFETTHARLRGLLTGQGQPSPAPAQPGPGSVDA